MSPGDFLLRSIKLQTPVQPLPLTVWRPARGSAAGAQPGTPSGASTTGRLLFDPVLLGRRDYKGAEDVFREALGYRSDYFPALAGLGAAQVKQHRPAQALEQLGKAAALAQQAQAWPFLAQIQLNIGSAQLQLSRRKEALAALSSAVKLDGATIYDDLVSDVDLAPLKSDADFRRLVEQARLARDKAKKR